MGNYILLTSAIILFLLAVGFWVKLEIAKIKNKDLQIENNLLIDRNLQLQSKIKKKKEFINIQNTLIGDLQERIN